MISSSSSRRSTVCVRVCLRSVKITNASASTVGEFFGGIFKRRRSVTDEARKAPVFLLALAVP